MSLMTDTDIKRALDRDIIIEPFNEESLTPVGYNFAVGEFVYSLEHGLLHEKDSSYILPAKSTVQILTKESLWVSKRVAGTFHSRVGLVSKGLSHISTTLDPGWCGPLLITMRNNTDHEILLRATDTFVTLVFFRTLSPASFLHNNAPSRNSILLGDIECQTDEYVRKVTTLLNDEAIGFRFKQKVDTANAPMSAKIISSLRKAKIINIVHLLGYVMLGGVCIILTVLAFDWDGVSFMFGEIKFDSTIFSVLLGSAITILLQVLKR